MELTLDRRDRLVYVRLGDTDSHTFPLADIAIAEDDPLVKSGDPQPFGARLFRALFPADSPARRALDALPPGGDLTLITDDADLQRMPWEYLWNGEYLSLKYLLMRGLPPERRIAHDPPGSSDGLLALVVVSDPLVYENGEPVVALDVTRERDNLKRAFEAAHAPYQVAFVKPPTLDELHKQLAGVSPGTILHFIGHGVATPQGARLLFEDRAGIAQPVPAEHFVAPAQGRVFLVFLNACQSATSLDTPTSNLAHALVGAGVPYVVGMQISVPEIVALRLSEFFYTFLAQGHSVEESLRQARMALARDEKLERVPLKDGGAGDLRAYATGIPVLYTAMAARGASLGRAAGEARIDDFQPRMDFDAPIAPAQKFRGRVAELAALGRLFERGHATEAEVDAARRREGRDPAGARVIVIRGEGGMGKSALARCAAERFDWRFRDGVLGLSLENLPKKDALVARIGTWLFGGSFDQIDATSRESAVVEALRSRSLLLILDNYESLEEALNADNPDAPPLAAFVESVAGGDTTLLITSRTQVVDLAGMRELLLEGLDEEAGRALFWDFASNKRREADESLAAEVVERVGGHPLALELVAKAYARTEQPFPGFVRGLNEQLAQARNRYKTAPRQQTLAGCFDYSFQFLPEKAQHLFPKLRLFLAPFHAEAVKVIFDEADAAQALHVLWQKSVIRAFEFAEDTPMYFLHPTARWYAEQKSEGDALEAQYGAKHAQVCQNIARAAYDSFAGKTNVADVQLARLSMPDLLKTREFIDVEARIWQCLRVAYLLQIFGVMSDANDLLREAEDLAHGDAFAGARSSVLFEMARLAVTRGDLGRAMQLYEQSLAIQEQLGDLKGKSATLHQMAGIFVTRGDLGRAMQLYEQSLAIKEQLGDLQGKSATLHAMANVWVTRGDLGRAMQLYEQSAAIDEQLGDLQGKSATLHAMANVWVTRGDLGRAMQLYEQSLAIKEQLGDLQGKIRTLANVAVLFERDNNAERALQLYSEALRISQEIEEPYAVANVLAMMSSVLIQRNENEQALSALIEALNILVKMEAQREASGTAQRLVDFKQRLGAEEFAKLWQRVTRGADMPEWLTSTGEG